MADTGRTDRGTFAQGHAPVPGAGRPRNAITRELRMRTDPGEVADFLIATMRNPNLPLKFRLDAAREIYDRVEGKPVAPSVSVQLSSASSVLPEHWESLPLEERRRWLDAFERDPSRFLPAGDS